MKIVHIILKVLLSLMLVSPILGTFGIFPEPTRDLYNTDLGFAYIQMLFEVGYVTYMMAIVMFVALIALWTKREGLAAALLAPLTANIIGFHAFVDGGIFTAGSIMADVLLLLNIYFLYTSREDYRAMLKLPAKPATVS